MPIASPPVCPILIDREVDLAALDRLLTDAANGQGRLVLLTGEAGTGKTRLAREVAARAAARGFQQLTGNCTERDLDFPFAPIVDAVRQQGIAATTERPELVSPRDGILAALLSELNESEARPGARGPRTPEQAKRRVFEAIVVCFARLADHQPLLVILEDLHWADPTSLELLDMLPRRLAASRLLVLATARVDEASAELHHLVVAQRRGRSAIELSLGPLDEAGVGRMLKALRATASSSVVAAVHARTGGNPFFIEELLATAPTHLDWLRGEAAVPETVQDTVLHRLHHLDPSAHDVVNLAAIIGQRFSFDLLLAASGHSPDELLAALRSLVDRHLIAEAPAGRESFAFRHALTRDALLGRLLAPQRRALHRIVAEAMERAPPKGQTTGDATRDLSYHFHAAGIWDKTLAYAMKAAAAADRLHATFEALTHHHRALDAAIALHDLRIADLHHRCGIAYARLGTFEEAKAHLEAAIAVAHAQGTTNVEQAALCDLAGLYASRYYAEARRLAEQAVPLARATADRRQEGLALNRLGNVFTNLLRFDEGRALHEDALAIFEAAHDQWGSADSLDLIGMARYLAGEVSEAREAFGQAAAIFAALGDLERVASAVTTRGLYLAVLDGPCATSDPPAVYRADAAEGLRLCQAIAWWSGEVYALVAVACAEIGAGAYGDAEEHAEQALALAEDIKHSQWMVIALLTLGLLEVELGNIGAATGRFQRALDLARAAGAVQWVERLNAWLAFCRVHGGETELPLLMTLPREPTTFRPASIGQRRLVAARATQDLAAGRLDDALAWIELLLAGAAGPRPAGALLLRAKVLAALGRIPEADAGYLDARRTAAAIGPRSVLWRAAAARAQLWQGRDATLATAEAAIAREEISAIAAALPNSGRRTSFLAAPEVQPWISASGRRRTADTAGPGHLTAREREVAVQVASGLSNKEIAHALTIAEKTVEMHVSSCLGKLGFASRAQLAAWVATQGLLPPPPSQG